MGGYWVGVDCSQQGFHVKHLIFPFISFSFSPKRTSSPVLNEFIEGGRGRRWCVEPGQEKTVVIKTLFDVFFVRERAPYLKIIIHTRIRMSRI